MHIIKKKVIFTFLIILVFISGIYIFSSKSSYLGYIEIEEKAVEEGKHSITFYKLDGDGMMTEASLDNVIFYENEEEVPPEYAISKIEQGKTYQVSLEEEKFPTIIFKDEIVTFYMD